VLAAIFGGSNLQVSGPTGAMTVVLVPIVARFGLEGVLVVGMLAGIILIGLAYAGAGRTMRYVPLPVIEGFTLLLSGIRAEHVAILDRLGVFAELSDDKHVFEHTPDAIAHARQHARRLHAAAPAGETAA
jgi:SulP family sulfate permease